VFGEAQIWVGELFKSMSEICSGMVLTTNRAGMGTKQRCWIHIVDSVVKDSDLVMVR